MNEENIFWDGSGKIIPSLLYRFLAANGFGKYFPNGKNRKDAEPVVVKLTRNIVSQVNYSYLIEFAHDNIITATEESGECGPILDSLHRNTSLFCTKNLMLLPSLDLQFISDTRDRGFAFFRNGVTVITRDGISLENYAAFDEYVWEKNIIDIDFHPADMTDIESFDFFQFIADLAHSNSDEHRTSRLNSLKSAIGYLLHRYKDGTTTKAIILMDVYVNGRPNGGSGKSLLINSIGKIRNLASIDGKKYDQREWFGLSSVGLETELLSFDDVKYDFNIEELFPLMTEGLFQRRKYRDHIFIPHKDSPKIALTTNYAINGDSSSFRRRMFEFEVSATYSSDFSPRDKFGRNFFDDWEEGDWNLFYNTMFQCLQIFLSEGLVESEPISISLTKFINKTCDEFGDWAEDHLRLNHQLDKKSLLTIFADAFPEYRMLKQRTFTDWLRAWGTYKRLSMLEGHTGYIRYITYSD